MAPVALIAAILAMSLFGEDAANRKIRIAYSETRPILDSLAEALPSEFRGKSVKDQAAAWRGWLARHDARIRSRLMRGDEDTLVNSLLYGTSFTNEPRLLPEDFARAPGSRGTGRLISLAELNPRTQEAVNKRTEDLIRAISNPGQNDRLLFLRWLVGQRGFKPDDEAGRALLRRYVAENLLRVLQESAGYAGAIDAARGLGDAGEEFVRRSTLFRDRGLSGDTSLRPDFAVEESLQELKKRKLLSPGGVRRVAIIGPGLDFTDKDSGYDLYPLQTLQPFAVIGSLLESGLAQIEKLDVITLDISPAVNQHIRRSRQRALRGTGYTVQLPLDTDTPWKPEFLRFWETFGAQIGSPTAAAKVPDTVRDIKLRAVRIRPDIVARLEPVELDVVTEHLDLPDSGRFDLIVATNVFVYYDVFEQCLALANVERMLRPGGFLLSNSALLELPESRIRSVGYRTVVYSDRRADGEHIVWYARLQDR